MGGEGGWGAGVLLRGRGVLVAAWVCKSGEAAMFVLSRVHRSIQVAGGT